MAYQSKISLPACYSYMEDVLLDCLAIGSAFSACGGWGHLVSEGNLCLPLCSWTDNSKYKLVAPLVPLSASKRPCSAPNRCSIPHLPADNAPPE
ncbi:hypothetical protein DSO57_1020876 [Entomophthora muscae]|uniref:Uncharacterized protein n=1 Tax=Entomophthora muscae TaxID=34485 RepID=A0ACC2S5M0_9FUNG|nr:hypothetical protein DSO57_1020876 [Entomophthora muscae]